jgi:hypothetical protein
MRLLYGVSVVVAVSMGAVIDPEDFVDDVAIFS